MSDKPSFDDNMEELILKLSTGCKKDSRTVSSRDVELSDEMEEKLPAYLNILKESNLISGFEYFFPGAWEITVTDALLSYFNDDSGQDASAASDEAGAQSDQNTVPGEEFISKVSEIVAQIKRYDIVLDYEFGRNADHLRNTAAQIEHFISTGKEPYLTMQVLAELKSFVISAGNGLLAHGLYRMIDLIL